MRIEKIIFVLGFGCALVGAVLMGERLADLLSTEERIAITILIQVNRHIIT